MSNMPRVPVIIFFLLPLFTGTIAKAQTQEEWARTVNWDGVSHWSKYIITTPAKMGPNALPVPFIGNGRIDSQTFVGSSLSMYARKGERSADIAVYGNYCIVKDIVSIDISYEPVEFYRTSDQLKKERNVYYENYYDNKARGDVHLNLNYRILRQLEKTIQLVLRIGYRYPASSGLQSARYTDGMGYYFDLSFGKSLKRNLRWIGMAGFYCWQMNGDGHRQNDAFLFGSGLEWNKNGWHIQAYGAGYLGYMLNSGDKPVVLRSHIEKRNSKTGFLLRLQQGVHDFRYSSAELGVKFFINRQAPSFK